jgi:hypothetical protein
MRIHVCVLMRVCIVLCCVCVFVPFAFFAQAALRWCGVEMDIDECEARARTRMRKHARTHAAAATECVL